MAKYTIGLDFGTLSARALVVDIKDGREVACVEHPYRHGVMDTRLPNGRPLPPDFALQHPMDYVEALEYIVPRAVQLSGANKEDIIGIGLDFTSSTVLPVTADGASLCTLMDFENEPQAYAKLWKHHAAAPYARRMEEVAVKRREGWLPSYGGRVSSEWFFPKLMETLDQAPRVYEKMRRYMEAGDWLVLLLTAAPSQNACMAGYKAFYQRGGGFPSPEYLAACDRRLKNVVAEKMDAPVFDQGTKVGGLGAEYAEKLGLITGIAVAAANVDAHVGLPAAGIDKPGQMLIILGTSACHLLLAEEWTAVPGICGSVINGILPGFVGMEAGQSCVGDLLDWFVKTAVPESYYDAAKARQINIHQYLQDLAKEQSPGEHGLLALDWWNGNRSILVDPDLSGLILGLTLATKPQDIYRALVEATAFGTRMIIENYRAHGVPVTSLCLSGGIAEKSPFIRQVFADVLGLPLSLSKSAQGSALGSAMFAALAAGKAEGGYDDIQEAIQNMGGQKEEKIVQNPAAKAVYDRLFALYQELHEVFGQKEGLLHQLKALKGEASQDQLK